jgi:hypothetical protein
MKDAMEATLAEDQRLRALEGEKNTALQAEQRKLDDLNEHLNELDRSLSATKQEK